MKARTPMLSRLVLAHLVASITTVVDGNMMPAMAARAPFSPAIFQPSTATKSTFGPGAAWASAIELVFNQRLIRRACVACDGAGCESCLRTGYNGRVPLVEWLRVDETIRDQIRRRELAAISPAQTLEASARLLVNQGVTDEKEFKRVFGL